MVQETRHPRDTLPCRHVFPIEAVEATKELLAELHNTAPGLLAQAGVEPADWPTVLRAAVESMRGTASATTSSKRRFVEAVLVYGTDRGVFAEWEHLGSEGRNDYRVVLPDGRQVGVEAKGCPDGNNTTIWDRPAWADEFVVWCLCADSLAHEPGEGVWSGVATRLLPKVTAERQVVDAMVFWDGRCGSDKRKCPKAYGVIGTLRQRATDILAQTDGPEGWLPPPCVYLFPRTLANVRTNRRPPLHDRTTCRFADAMLSLFNVPEDERDGYVHHASIEVEGTERGTRIQIGVTSRLWPDGEDRLVSTRPKILRRE